MAVCYSAQEAIISIHALLAESDDKINTGVVVIQIFLSTLSLRRATDSIKPSPHSIEISIHALLAESDGKKYCTRQARTAAISIHALLAESDTLCITELAEEFISIHALLAESDAALVMRCKALMRFLSTLSLRRATVIQCAHRVSTVDFYPRSPCGERPTSKLGRLRVFRFLSTLSLRRATKYGYCRGWGFYISIHALLAESDLGRAAKPVMTAGISIHALLAESDGCAICAIIQRKRFLSTLSLRRATEDYQ